MICKNKISELIKKPTSIKYTILLIVFLSINFKLFSQKITRGPYLQAPGKYQITIKWRTDVATSSKVNYGDLAVFDASENTEHEVVLKNLLPNTNYKYNVGSASNILGSGSFTTAPIDTERPIIIWAMGDFGDNSSQKYIDNQLAVKNAYMNTTKTTDLWLWLGDNAYCCGFDSEYQKQVFDIYGTDFFSKTPIAPSPGNHEYLGTSTGQTDRNIDYFNIVAPPINGENGGLPSGTKAYYSYDYGNVHFVSLDSYGFDKGYRFYQPQSPQYQWLEADLAQNTKLWTVVYFHHPPYTKNSHDSDFEPELAATRQGLVPIFDKYKVDLVLNGHSHLYERSYLIKGNTGPTTTFDFGSHVVQNTTGRYEPDHAPFINKNEGTIYAVVGSTGRFDLNGSGLSNPNNAYYNWEIGGSMKLKILDNRLDAQWIAADGLVRDKFTVFKNVNKTQQYKLQYGDSLTLSASWNGSYIWKNYANTSKSLKVRPLVYSVFEVSDSLGFLKDVFEVEVGPQPEIKTNILPNQIACVGSNINFNFDLINTFDKWQYTLQISDENGNFERPSHSQVITKKESAILLPKTLNLNKTYKIRVVPNSDLFLIKESEIFQIKYPVTAQITNAGTQPYTSNSTLDIRLTGSLPATLQINDFPPKLIDTELYSWAIAQTNTAEYTISLVKNECGIGQIMGSSYIVSAPLSTEPTGAYKLWPNPVIDELFIENSLLGQGKAHAIIYDITGKQVATHSLDIDKIQTIKTSKLAIGSYILAIKSNNKTTYWRFLKVN